MPFLLLFLSGTCSALASILLRVAGQGGAQNDVPMLALVDRSMLLRMGALATYGAGFAFYALALKSVQVSVAYPLMVAVTVLEILIFGFVGGEAMSTRTIAGAALLLVSVFLLFGSDPPRA